MTNDLAKPTLITPDFTVDANGKAWISQTKLALLCGLDRSTISTGIRRNTYTVADINLNENKQLDAESAYAVAVHYAKQGNETAFDLVTATGKAGFTALIYKGAGYSISAVTQQPRPLTFIESLELLLESEKEKERLRIENLNQSVVIAHKNIKTDCADTHFTIKRIRSLNQGMKIDPKILLKVSKDLDSEVETVYDHYEQPINQYSRNVWEEAYPDAILP